ncbi:classical arabinogalactan protein 9-like [Sorghum bicolor]|uniref:classical arabinogalactan protein 9-like n=1 Tax=Sorghum bicolor TaxID=4558 RepID=UPI000B426AB1|nr:classical arabinogalactan protein 9-like [Sorghum bicolor]|eukprot:XP_021315161.1 classical arabinogalactan protein 9-like [Sorghum bicolor]
MVGVTRARRGVGKPLWTGQTNERQGRVRRHRHRRSDGFPGTAAAAAATAAATSINGAAAPPPSPPALVAQPPPVPAPPQHLPPPLAPPPAQISSRKRKIKEEKVPSSTAKQKVSDVKQANAPVMLISSRESSNSSKDPAVKQATMD